MFEIDIKTLQQGVKHVLYDNHKDTKTFFLLLTLNIYLFDG